MRLSILFSLSLLLVAACSKKSETREVKSEFIPYSLQRTLPHDTKAFTQGLIIHKGLLYESTGQENQSWIGVVDVNTGIAGQKTTLDGQYFGEGITILNNKVYQLTWKNKIGFVYDLTTFKKLRDFTYATEGWGLTHNNTHLIMSDGSENLFFLDTVNLSVVKKLSVTYQGDALKMLNELEYVNGFIYANVWQSNRIAKIDAATGNVTGFIDLTSLAEQAAMVNPQQDVLNGIAWHPGTQSLLVTGKYWPYIYVIKTSEPATAP